MPEVLFEQSVWFIPICLGLAAALAYLVYSRKPPWTSTTNKLLTVVRFALFAILLILLLNPLLNQIVTDIEPPTFVIALDNSESMIQGKDDTARDQLLTTVEQLSRKLKSKNYKVVWHTLDAKVELSSSVMFDQKTTNLDGLLRNLQLSYEGTNLAGVYLFSDGRYNQGASPAYFPYNIKVNSLGIGDTLQKKDIELKNILYNKIAYQGNKFPVVVEVVNHGFESMETLLQVRNKGKLMASETVQFTSPEGLASVELEVEADEKGMQPLDISIRPIKGESLNTNNYKRIFVDVIDGKQKILLVAPTPDPDMKALASLLEKNQNYELTQHIPGVNDFKTDKYDLVISHQAYSRYKKVNEIVEAQREKGVPALLIFGQRSNILMASRSEEYFSFTQRGAKRDLIYGAISDEFTLFTIPEEARTNFSQYPPISVPYGNARIPANAQVLLYQRVGSIQTNKPLLYFVEQNNQKNAFMLASGFWKWRMQESAVTDATATFDDIFLKMIQYLSTKVDKRKFKFYPSSTTYSENQMIAFHAEIYNQIYERVFGQQILIKITNDQGFAKEYNFAPASEYSKLELSGLPTGLYSYEASVNLNGQTEVVFGKFSVAALQLEAYDQVADFQVLRRVSENTGGNYYANQEQLLADIDQFQLHGVIHSHEDVFPVVHLKWILLVLITLVSLEWSTRKYNGGY